MWKAVLTLGGRSVDTHLHLTFCPFEYIYWVYSSSAVLEWIIWCYSMIGVHYIATHRQRIDSQYNDSWSFNKESMVIEVSHLDLFYMSDVRMFLSTDLQGISCRSVHCHKVADSCLAGALLREIPCRCKFIWSWIETWLDCCPFMHGIPVYSVQKPNLLDSDKGLKRFGQYLWTRLK